MRSANELINRTLTPYPEDLVIVTKVGPGSSKPASIAEHFGALAELRDAGMVRHFGLSGVQPHHLAQAQEIAPVVCVQNSYGVDNGRANDEFLHR